MSSKRATTSSQGKDAISRFSGAKEVECVEIDNTFAAILGVSEGQRVGIDVDFEDLGKT